MVERPLAPLERSAGILIPNRVQEFFRRPTPLGEHWTPYSIDELNVLSHLFPNHPLGCIPLFKDEGGNGLCLYYPDRPEPLLCGFDREQGWIIPLDDVVEDVFDAPERYEDPKRRGEFKPARETLPFWDSLALGSKGSAWAQFLKPWVLSTNARVFEAERDCAHETARSCGFRALLARLADEGAPTTLFGRAADVRDWYRWFRLGCALQDAGRHSEATAVFSNALFVASNTEPLWSKALLIAEKLLLSLRPPALPLYAQQVQRWLPLLREWAGQE